MKIFFDHIAGKLTNYDLLYSLILAEFEPEEYDYALNNGWIPLSWYYTEFDNLTWINARSCRLDLSKFTFSKKQKYILNKKDVTVDIAGNPDKDILADIYKKYIRHKQFYEKNNEKESEEFMRDDPLDWKYFVYYHKGKPVAFTELMVLGKHLITGQFAWDYENEKLGLGTYATLFEIKWCLDNNIDKYYLSYAYENASSYKAKYDGFEFWTGRKWLTDKDTYIKLCNNDSQINTLVDLNDYQDKYFKIVKGYYEEKKEKEEG